MTTYGRQFVVEQITDVPRSADVADFDQLDRRAQAALTSLANGSDPPNPEPLAELDSDVVRFTDYYRVSRAGQSASD